MTALSTIFTPAGGTQSEKIPPAGKSGSELGVCKGKAIVLSGKVRVGASLT
jgi:hypothetical protein